MITLFTSFKSLIKFQETQTDNNVFKLHYRVTVILLLAFSVLLTSKEYFGEPIKCDVDEKRKDVIDTFCWIYGTFIIKRTLNNRYLPGLGLEFEQDPKAVTRQMYYQWVCIVFCVQAFIFYLPRYLWKIWEGGRLHLLVKDLNEPVESPNWNDTKSDNLVKYLLDGKGSNNIYTIRYCFCELLNLLNVIGQICFLDWFITGKFTLYGINFATFSKRGTVNPMNEAFPKITKCTYFKVGPSGTQELRDALCILPLNVLNEKFFLILWYWFCFLLVLSFLSLIYRALFLFVPIIRVHILRAQTKCLDRKKSQVIINHISFGDFFVMYKIGKNLHPSVFREFILNLYDNIEKLKV